MLKKFQLNFKKTRAASFLDLLLKLVLKNGFILATIFFGQKMEINFLHFYVNTSNKPFPSCPKPLFQSQAKCETIDMKMFFILMQIKLIFTTKVLHVAVF